MAAIIKGTTPTIAFTFSTVEISDITTAILTIKKDDEIVIEKDLTSATVEESRLLWTLSQSETLSIAGMAEIMLNWVTEDSTRGASEPMQVRFLPNHKEEVI